MKYIYHNIYLLSIFKLAGLDIKNIENIHQIVRNRIINYCASILFQYINFDIKLFDRDRFFREVYSKNVDIYGIHYVLYTSFY